MKIAAKSCLLLCGTSAVMLAPTVAHAQTGPTGDQSPPQHSATGTEIEDIVVTAQRRAQSLEDVGLTVNVLTGAELEGTTSLVDLQSLAPNLQIKNVTASGVTNVAVRGIGLNDYAANNNPAAGIYVDNVYLVSPAMLIFGIFDVDRIEVLKGPQGDLYGRNTTAGAVNVISRRPSATPDVEMEAGYGRYGYWHFDGAVGGPLSSTLNGRFAVQTVQQESGWQTNFVTGGHGPGLDRTNGRLQLEWEPSSALDILLSAHAGYDRSDNLLYKADNITTTEEDPFANRPYVAGGSNDPRRDVRSAGASMTVGWSLSSDLTLTSISAYEYFRRSNTEDIDGVSLRQLDSTFKNRINQYSEEARLAYSHGGLELIGGVFYSHDTVVGRDFFTSPDLLPLFGLAGFDTIGNTYRQRTDSYAAFAHAEWTFAPRWTLVGGLRYTHEHKIFDQATTFLGANGVFFDIFPAVRNTYSTSNLSGKIGLNWEFADHSLLYANVSRGFKSGGFQGQLAFDPAVLQPFNDEKLTAYELGLRSRVLPNLQVSAAVFDYEYHDAQFYGPLFDSPVGVLFGIDNVGNARVRGAEADVSWRPATGLDLRFGIGWIDTRITKSVVAGVATGSELPNAPELTFNGTARYNWALTNNVRADVTLSGNYQSRVAFDIVRAPPQAIEGPYFVANAEVGLSIGDHWRVAVWARNLFDEVYRTQALSTSVGWAYLYGTPRTYGINLSYSM